MTRDDWIIANKDILIGCLKVVKGDKGKTPLKGEFKDSHWLFSETNPSLERVTDCIAHSNAHPDNGIGILLPDSILVVDLDNKPYSPDDGVASWKLICDVTATMKSSSGVGEHIWMRNPLPFAYKTTYDIVSGNPEHKPIELFGGSKQYLKLPDNDFDWSLLNLDELPSLPSGFLDGITEVRKVDEVAVIDEAIEKFEMDFKGLFPYIAMLNDLPHRPDQFKVIAAMKGFSDYHRIFHGDNALADKLKALTMWALADMAVAGRYPPEDMWKTAKFLGKQGASINAIAQYSNYKHSPFGMTDSDKAFIFAKFKDFKNDRLERTK